MVLNMRTEMLEVEQSVLGCILIGFNEQEMIENIMTELEVDDFLNDRNKIIFKTMKSLFNKGSVIDFVTLIDELESLKLLESVGSVEYICTLTNIVPSTSSYKYYIEILKKNSKTRYLKKIGADTINKLNSGDSSEKVFNDLQNELEKISNKEIKNEIEHIEIASNQEYERIERTEKGKYDEFGIATGYPVLDKILWGFQPSDLIIVGARAGVGKTALALNFMDYIANQLKKSCLFFSLEMPKLQIVRRLYSIYSEIDNFEIKRAKFLSPYKSKLEETKNRLNNGKLFIDDTSSSTVNEMLLKAKQHKRKYGLDIVFVDYLQFITASKKSGNRFQDIGEIARELKQMARTLNVPVVALAQLNRVLDNENRFPTLADLSDSSEIEKNADIIMFLHERDKRTEEERKMDLLIAKFRNGQLRTIRMKYVGKFFKFYELEKPQSKTIQEKIPDITPIDDDNDFPF